MIEYAELHCHSYYSLLDGASSPQALLNRAREIGLSSLALTDHNNLYGAVEFALAAQAVNVQPIFGAEMTLTTGAHLTLLVKNNTGWENLCWLITQAQHNAPKGEALLEPGWLEGKTPGLVALSGCRRGVISSPLLAGSMREAMDAVAHYAALFGKDSFFIELHNHLLKDDALLNESLARVAQQCGLGLIAANNVHYARRDSRRLQDVLVCIRERTTLDEGSAHLRPNSEYYLKSGEAMARLFHAYPGAVRNTRVIAEQCRFLPAQGFQTLPEYPTPEGQPAEVFLRDLCLASPRCTAPEIHERLDHELAIINRAGLANYFLVVWDIVRFARDNKILCQGRGSAANSVIAYLLNISPINPLTYDLVFERFLSDERRLTPDIDIDFDAARREEVIQYVYARYGTDHAAMACTFVTFRSRSAIRDIGKALGLSLEIVNAISRTIDRGGAVDGLKSGSTTASQLLDLCEQIHKTPRHLGIHNGGMVITRAPLATRLPTEPATMVDRFVTQWDKEGLEDSGIIKIDILGLRMLSAVDDATRLAGVDLDTLTYDNPRVYQMISAADTIGVFQVESRAQAQSLPRFQPRCFEDLIIAISLIRPGPIQGNMVHPYLRRRLGEEPVDYYHPLLEPALKETLGVILFQEQVLKVARDLAGFTPGQGELLRRALGRKDAAEAIRTFENAFIQGALNKGVPLETARMVFQKLLGFGSYSFPKSHAAAFAVLVYQSAWLRRYHPAPFYVALLNHQPMGFWSPAVVINDAKRHNVPVYRVDLYASGNKCRLEGSGFRLGFNYVKGLGETGAERILTERAAGRFAGLEDFCRRTRLPPRLIENLILAGAMRMWGKSRRKLIWALGRARYDVDELHFQYAGDEVDLPAPSPIERLDMDYRAMGVSLDPHIMTLYKDWLDQRGVIGSQALETTANGALVTIAGKVVSRQSPQTAKGFQFITLEDDNGFMNAIVRPGVYERFRQTIRGHRLLIVKGPVQRARSVINVLAQEIHPLPPLSR